MIKGDYLEKINVAKIVKRSLVNGPGVRAVIWVQGCDKKCPGCINQEFQAKIPRCLYSSKELVEQISPLEEIEGITLSGGEPLLQLKVLMSFITEIRNNGLSIACYTGYSFDEISDSNIEILKNYIDFLITEPFQQEKLQYKIPMIGSSNQKFHFFTDRYCMKDIENIPNFEIYFGNNELLVDGIIPPEILDKIKKSFRR